MTAACEDVRGIFKSVTALKQSNVAGPPVEDRPQRRRERRLAVGLGESLPRLEMNTYGSLYSRSVPRDLA